MPTAAAKQTVLVTKDELLELAEWERKSADAKKKASAAEKELKFRRLALAEKVLGVKSEDDLKALTPAQVETRSTKRFDAGDWKTERGAPAFAFVKSSSGSYPAWRQLFVEELGETAAVRIAADIPLTYSYRVDVTLS